ncbi:MAG: M20/M25/M40 family metallo-hydrolase [Thiotrichaceae bacterium]
MLAGHSDTVPYDSRGWNTNPFDLIEENQRLYGLGTSDMKSFFALALAWLCNLIPTPPPTNLFDRTADEEGTMSGAKYLVKSAQLTARYALIRATNLRPIRMHKGIFMEAIHLNGLSRHSARSKFRQ